MQGWPAALESAAVPHGSKHELMSHQASAFVVGKTFCCQLLLVVCDLALEAAACNLGVPHTSTSRTLLAGLGGDAGGILAGTDLRVDLGAAFLRVLGAAEPGIPARWHFVVTGPLAERRSCCKAAQ
jgi:hypothetical protein